MGDLTKAQVMLSYQNLQLWWHSWMRLSKYDTLLSALLSVRKNCALVRRLYKSSVLIWLCVPIEHFSGCQFSRKCALNEHLRVWNYCMLFLQVLSARTKNWLAVGDHCLVHQRPWMKVQIDNWYWLFAETKCFLYVNCLLGVCVVLKLK